MGIKTECSSIYFALANYNGIWTDWIWQTSASKHFHPYGTAQRSDGENLPSKWSEQMFLCNAAAEFSGSHIFNAEDLLLCGGIRKLGSSH